MSLLQAALAAHATKVAAEQEAVEKTRRQMRQDGEAALRVALTRPDGTPMPLEEAGLSRVYADMSELPDTAVVVWTSDDGKVSLATQYRDKTWTVRIVEFDDGRWRPAGRGGRVTELADIGAWAAARA